MPRPKAADPRIMVGLRLPRSVLDLIAPRAENRGETIAEWIERVVRAQVEPPVTIPASALVRPGVKHAPTCRCVACAPPK